MPAYREAGVDVAAGERLVEAIADDVTATWTDHVVGGFGGFAAGVTIPAGYRRPVLMMSTDGIGTKIEVARRAGLWTGLGFDLVAMCVDDLAAVGATPLAFTDYLAVGALDHERERALVGSIATACKAAGCALLGGETAEHPGVMAPEHVDVAGAALGIVEHGEQVDGQAIEAGDVVVGIASPNLRSNGFSLVRSIVDLNRLSDPFPGDHRSTGEVLCEPSVIYAPAIGAATVAHDVAGLAHITGGGIPGNIARPIARDLAVDIDPTTWQPPNVFAQIQQLGGVSTPDMFATFNMGIGFAVFCSPSQADPIIDTLSRHGHSSTVIGQVTHGHHRVEIDGVATY